MKAWSDTVFKERLIEEPKTVLAEEGIETPNVMSIEVVENTAEKIFLTLPLAPLHNILTDEDIEGLFSSAICCLPPYQTLGGLNTWKR